MNKKTAIIITSISAPNDVLKSIAKGAKENNIEFILIGDVPSPKDFFIDGCDFYGMDRQKELDFKLAKILPERHYGRKNLGYLIAQKNGATLITETDDDNFPRKEFWNDKRRKQTVATSENDGWLNVFGYFSDKVIWPRGFPLEKIQDEQKQKKLFKTQDVICPVQQGLADENPDVDAVYRLTYPLPLKFDDDFSIAVGKNTWCPFNSQNTAWFEEAFPLMYLPSYCSFRMTDIWRSFVAQRILWENDWHLLFHKATVWQERNEHDLMKDFKDEIPGYLNNDRIVKTLEALDLKSGKEFLGENLKKCYQKLVDMELVGKEELNLIDAWLEDISKIA
ncbi:MAG: STELLO glycosyltransferase family protein [Bacteroidota bacterium]|nr:STELLO glycosyltransferase family protein [Bacteroidota bacterium]